MAGGSVRKEEMHEQVNEAPISEGITSMLNRIPTKMYVLLELKTEGAKRIGIELWKEPAKRNEYIMRYNELVADISSILKSECPKMTEEQFITEIWGIMNTNLKIKYGDNKFGFMPESMRTGDFDCETSAFLVYDVAKRLGINVSMVSVPPLKEEQGHVLVITGNFFFETTGGEYFPVSKLADYYPIRQVLEESQIQSITYGNRGIAYSDLGDNKQAIKDYTEAIRINPKLAEAYYNRGVVYSASGNNRQAIKDYTEAIRINPEYVEAHNNRGNAYDELKSYKQAIKDYTEAIRINPKDAEVYFNRALAYEEMGEKELVKKDREKYRELREKELKV